MLKGKCKVKQIFCALMLEQIQLNLPGWNETKEEAFGEMINEVKEVEDQGAHSSLR